MGRSDPLQGIKRDLILNIDLYRTFKYSISNGFAASGKPLRIDSPWEELSGPQRDELMLGELLAFLRIASLNSDDLENNKILKGTSPRAMRILLTVFSKLCKGVALLPMLSSRAGLLSDLPRLVRSTSNSWVQNKPWSRFQKRCKQ